MLDRILGARSSSPSTPAYGASWFSSPRAAAGVNVNEDTALSVSAVFGAVKVISETVALLPWRHYRQGDARRELLAGTDVDVLLHRHPNGEMSAFPFREYLIACALLHGNGYAEIERSRSGAAIALHLLHPERVEPKRTTGGVLFYEVRNENGSVAGVPARQMFHLRGPTKDGIVGRSVLSLARESLGVAIAAEKFAGGFFGNGAIPSLFIEQTEAAPKLSKEGAENMLESFERRHKGPGKAGKAALLEQGYTIKPVGIPQKDAQFLETRKFSVTEVARWFRVPPHKIADMERATFSNIEEQERNFVNDAVIPWSARLEQEAAFKLLTRADEFTLLDVRGLLRGKNEDRAKYYTQLRDLGVLSINEIRELEDMNPIEGGDLRLVPLNMVSVQRAGQSGGTDPASAVRGVLLEAHERMFSKEAKAVERTRSSSKDLVAWAQDFYARHEEQLRDALMPGARAVGDLRGLDVDLVAGVVESHAKLLCELSITAAVQGAPIEADPKRVAAQTDRLIGRLIGASNAQ